MVTLLCMDVTEKMALNLTFTFHAKKTLPFVLCRQLPLLDYSNVQDFDWRMFSLVPAKHSYLEFGNPDPCQADESSSCVQNIYYHGIKPYGVRSIATGADLSPTCSSIRKKLYNPYQIWTLWVLIFLPIKWQNLVHIVTWVPQILCY